MESRDITIIGGGPTGLAAAFRAGMHEASARIIEIASQLGGQVTALYPHKSIYDVFGFPEVMGKSLISNLVQQGLQFGADVRYGETVQRILRHDDGGLEVVTECASYPTRSVIIAGGIGTITPRKHDAEGCDRLEGKGVNYAVSHPEAFRGKRLVIVGGGDSALDWVMNLVEVAARVTLVHRSDEFEGHAYTAHQVQQLADHGRIHLYNPAVVTAVVGNEHLEGVTIRTDRGLVRTIEADALLPMIGFHMNLGPMADWGLQMDQKKILVNSRMETNLPGVFAAGDVVTYSGKIKLIATGFAEAAIAVKSAVEHMRPGQKARLQYSSVGGLPKRRSQAFA
ncbi:MAG: NAD(P)/FAD-dependent oxidoreductase [Acidobacteria bacterium]|nr:NAD(P)/FAD-dependent oxidoreductase [Acidobacteriota bacterium]